MGNAVKVFAVFSKQFWPEDMWDVVCTDRLYPEVWMTKYPVESTEAVDSQDLCCVTAFNCGERAERLQELSPRDAVQRLVQQLDEVFGGSTGATPATTSFVRGYVKDWSKEPYIEGAYTSPSLGAREGDRALIAAAEGGVLFFAGEHTNSGLNPCVQGAMQTGALAAADVARVLGAGPIGSRL
jgi:monoamine oxidase